MRTLIETYRGWDIYFDTESKIIKLNVEQIRKNLLNE